MLRRPPHYSDRRRSHDAAEGLVKLLNRRFDVVATVADGTALVEAAERFPPTSSSRTWTCRPSAGWKRGAAQKRGVASESVILTMHKEASVAARAMRAGASAFLLKHSAGRDELIDAIDEVVQADVFSRPRSPRYPRRPRWAW